MVVKLVILYPPPADADIFEAAVVDEHMPILLAKLPCLTRCVLSKAIWTFSGALPFHLMAELYFPSLEALQTALPVEVVNEIADHVVSICATGVPVSVACMEEVVSDEERVPITAPTRSKLE